MVEFYRMNICYRPPGLKEVTNQARKVYLMQSGINEVSKTGLLSPLRSKPLVPNRLYFTLVQSEVKPIWDQGFAT